MADIVGIFEPKWAKYKNMFGKEYEHKSKYFLYSLTRNVKFIYIPEDSEGDNSVECISMALEGMKTCSRIEKALEEMRIDYKVFQLKSDGEFFSQMLDIEFHIHKETSIVGGKEITMTNVIGRGENSIALLKSDDAIEKYAWMVPTKKTTKNPTMIYPLLDLKKCNTCCKWIKKSYHSHIKECVRCNCGSAYNKNKSEHGVGCLKNHFRKKQKAGISKSYEKAQEDNISIKNCMFADFETFCEKRHHTPYSACINTSEHGEKEAVVFSGKNCMEKFFDFLLERKGILFFYNGGRFDFYFMLTYCLDNGIKIKEDSLSIKGTTILTFTILNFEGEAIVLKDMWRFTPGSLKSNCIAYGVAADMSKTDFDHDKIKTWEDVARHRKEYEEYVKLDVISMRAIWEAYSKVIFEDHKVHASKFMTASHLAYGAWSANSDVGHLMEKTPKEDEEQYRSFYRGGRVMVGRPTWQSKSYETMKLKMELIEKDGEQKHQVDKEFYDSIEHYAVYGDVNSLYPAVMVNRKYPLGKAVHTVVQEFENSTWVKSLYENSDESGAIWERTAAKISAICPGDLMIAFLMEKEENGIIKQTLNPKIGQWYTGPELKEAIKLGYKITHIHEVYQWPECKEIFNDFIQLAYKRKSEAPNNTPIYTTNKRIMNDLSGKMAQMSILQKTLIISNEEDMNKLLEKNKKAVHHLTAIQNTSGDDIAYMVKQDIEKEYSDYPIQLSAFILGWSKVLMSKLIRKMGIERDEDMAIIYGDTDSYIMDSRCWDRMPEKYKSTATRELGKMKLEINGKIVKVMCMAPKTYMLIYVDGKTYEVKAKMACKGIPHIKDEYPAFVHAENIGNASARSKRDDSEKSADIQMSIGGKAYEFKYQNENGEEEVKILSRIPCDLFEKLTGGEAEMYCHFGTMKRTFEYDHVENINIENVTTKRQLGKTKWWQSGRRIITEETKKGFKTAYPPGHTRTMDLNE